MLTLIDERAIYLVIKGEGMWAVFGLLAGFVHRCTRWTSRAGGWVDRAWVRSSEGVRRSLGTYTQIIWSLIDIWLVQSIFISHQRPIDFFYHRRTKWTISSNNYTLLIHIFIYKLETFHLVYVGEFLKDVLEFNEQKRISKAYFRVNFS